MSQYLLLIETTANQRYIFATNRLREVVGASELLHQVIMSGVEKGKEDSNKGSFFDEECTKISVSSGKAILLVEGEKAAKEIIKEVTFKAHENAPGVSVHGVYVELKEETKSALTGAIKDAHEEMNELKSKLPSNMLRFQRLPVVDECRTSGLPAMMVDEKDPSYKESRMMALCSKEVGAKREQRENGVKRINKESRTMALCSKEVAAKREQREKGVERINKKLFQDTNKKGFKDIDELEGLFSADDTKWIAVVHADGNALGEKFLNFDSVCKEKDFDFYIERYFEFSEAIEKCTWKALKQATENVWRGEKKIPIIPLVVGGDDVTVICEGKKGVVFAAEYIKAFKEITELESGIVKVLEGKAITACAGVVITKPHYPFYRGYALAEQLVSSAKKKVKAIDKENPGSGLDFHILFDSAESDLDLIRERLEVDNRNTCLTAKPYLLDDFETVLEKAKKLSDIPSTQQHALREALFLGKAYADTKLKSIYHRYDKENWDVLLDGNRTLFYQDSIKEKDITKEKNVTIWLDIMELADLMGNDLLPEDKQKDTQKNMEAA